MTMTSGGLSFYRYWLRSIIAISFCFCFVVSDPPWQCRVCEDVLNTYHDHYRCAGDFIWNSEMKACEGPIIDCNLVKEELQQPCRDMILSFQQLPDNAKKIWQTMMEKGNVYKTCVALSKCDPDPAGQKKGTPCHEAFRSSECEGRLQCALFETQCSPQCYLCQIIIRDWPLFQEICKPEGAVIANAIDVDENAAAAAHPFAGTRIGTGANAGNTPPGSSPTTPVTATTTTPSNTPTTTRNTRLIELGDMVQVASSGGNGAAASPAPTPSPGGDDRTSVMTGYTLTQECFRQYNAIVLSNKTRYFTQWKKPVTILTDTKDRLFMNYWDANIACKCIGQCPLGRYEDLSLMETCRFESFEELFAEYLFKTPQRM